MRKLFTILILLFASVSYSQSTVTALNLTPITKAQRLAIVSPKAGMSVYQSDFVMGIYTYTSGGWIYSSKGDQGVQGVQGVQGPQGIQGGQGIKGDKGDTGSQGIQGVPGEFLHRVFEKNFINADSLIVLQFEHQIANPLNIRIEPSGGGISIVPWSKDSITKKITVKFSQKKSGKLIIY
jgi:hypothetical protein